MKNDKSSLGALTAIAFMAFADSALASSVSETQLNTQALQALTAEITPVATQLSDIMSFGLGALCGIAFVISSSMRWGR